MPLIPHIGVRPCLSSVRRFMCLYERTECLAEHSKSAPACHPEFRNEENICRESTASEIPEWRTAFSSASDAAEPESQTGKEEVRWILPQAKRKLPNSSTHRAFECSGRASRRYGAATDTSTVWSCRSQRHARALPCHTSSCSGSCIGIRL